MIHWTKFATVVLAALVLVSVIGKVAPIGFFW